jgi:peptidoglycan/xylan/chitin deacetylase (PgdA/CDA1 family)
MEIIGMRRPRKQIFLNFHGLGTPHRRVPDPEIPYWATEERFTAIIDEIVKHRDRGRDIRLTFDDGNLSDLTIGAPIIASRGISAEYFVLAGRLDDERYLSPDDIAELLDMGMSIGLHGRNHVDWRTLDPSELQDETFTARDELQAITGFPVSKVSVPFGRYDRHVIEHLDSLRFQTIYTSDGGPTRPDARIKARTSFRSDMTAQAVQKVLSGHLSLKRRIRRLLSMNPRQKTS